MARSWPWSSAISRGADAWHGTSPYGSESGDQRGRGVAIGDEVGHQTAPERALDGGVLASPAGDSDAAGHGAERVEVHADHSVAELGSDGSPLCVDEPQAHVTDAAFGADEGEVLEGEHVAAAGEQG